MILFIFEGHKSEPKLFEAIQELFFPRETEAFVCTYNSNIYSLYSKLKSYDIFDNVNDSANTVAVLNEILKVRGDETLADISSSDVSEIFLFFDYDFQDSRLTLKENNAHVEEMLNYFNNETETGKLYINYPMVESLRYTKKLPDLNYTNYVVSREDCNHFKNIVHSFSSYSSWDYLLLSKNKNEKMEKREKKRQTALENWNYLIKMNIEKANLICNGIVSMPVYKASIEQSLIYENQLQKYVNTSLCEVAVLNAFPLFLYDYFKVVL